MQYCTSPQLVIDVVLHQTQLAAAASRLEGLAPFPFFSAPPLHFLLRAGLVAADEMVAGGGGRGYDGAQRHGGVAARREPVTAVVGPHLPHARHALHLVKGLRIASCDRCVQLSPVGPQTLLDAVILLPFIPTTFVYGASNTNWQNMLSHTILPIDVTDYMICTPCHGAVIGAWLGAWSMPLDWERPWGVKISFKSDPVCC